MGPVGRAEARKGVFWVWAVLRWKVRAKPVFGGCQRIGTMQWRGECATMAKCSEQGRIIVIRLRTGAMDEMRGRGSSPDTPRWEFASLNAERPAALAEVAAAIEATLAESSDADDIAMMDVWSMNEMDGRRTLETDG